MKHEPLPTRRRLLRDALGFTSLATIGALPRASAQLAPATSAARPAAVANAAAAARPTTGTQIVLLGTRAGPGIDLKRAQTSTAILVDGVPYLVDCGYGAVRNLNAAEINGLKIEKIAFTHLHNDHTTDLPALLSLQWTGGRTQPIEIYGPYGTADMVRAIVDYCKADVGIRTVDEGRETSPANLYHGHDIDPGSKITEVFRDERVKVTAIENTHFPEHSRSRMPYRSMGLRFDTKTRSVVISGDTSYSKNLVELAKDVDVFICEVMDQSVRDAFLVQQKQDPQDADKPSVARHVSETHSTPEEVGRMAAEAKAKLVVLNHQLTSAGTTLPLAPLLEGVRRFYAGEVVFGQDLLTI
ncbi:MAG: MBL fold metallo-hydrolase [Pseudomonadota bacterium]